MCFWCVNKLILILVVVMFCEYSESMTRLTDRNYKGVLWSGEKKMANESNPENVDNNSVTDKSRTTISFTISSAPRSSQEDNSTASAVHDTTEARYYIPPWKTVFCIMASLAGFCSSALRVSLSVAIVAMVNQTAISDDHVVTTNISDTDQCPRDQELERADGQLTWDRHQQGTALAAFYYGRIVTQVIFNTNCATVWSTFLVILNQFHVSGKLDYCIISYSQQFQLPNDWHCVPTKRQYHRFCESLYWK